MRPPRGGGGNSWGNRGGGGFRGGQRGGFRGGGGRGGFRDEGPPDEVVEISTFSHACEGEAVVKLINEAKVPYFNAPIYLENKSQIGKVEEIFGPINEAYFSIKMQEGIIATSYSPGDKFYVDPRKTLPLERFTQPEVGGGGRGGRGGGRGGSRGGRGGGFRGGGMRGRGGGGFRGGGGRGFRGRGGGRGRGR